MKICKKIAKTMGTPTTKYHLTVIFSNSPAKGPEPVFSSNPAANGEGLFGLTVIKLLKTIKSIMELFVYWKTKIVNVLYQ
jgi:hypothetical protein